MKIGIIADSHGHAQRTIAAVELLRSDGAQTLVHLGDFETLDVIDALAGFDAHIVFGNCDWDVRSLTDYARGLGLSVDHPMGRLDLDGRRVAFTHGHIERLIRQALADRVDYLLHGHSHELRDERVGPTRIINPGALFRAQRYTAATLDLARDELKIMDVPRLEA
jgi:hypothetical protein